MQSYGSRYVRPPIISGDVSRTGPMTVHEFQLAQAVTTRPVKGMLTGAPGLRCVGRGGARPGWGPRHALHSTARPPDCPAPPRTRVPPVGIPGRAGAAMHAGARGSPCMHPTPNPANPPQAP